MSGGICTSFSYLKALSFQNNKVKRMLMTMENLFTCVGKIFFHERKYWRHKRITNYSFHTWQKEFDGPKYYIRLDYMWGFMMGL